MKILNQIINYKTRQFNFYLLGVLAVIALVFVITRFDRRFQNQELITKISTDWYQYAMEAERYTDGYRGPVAARMYAYVGLAAYEAALPFLDPDYNSLSFFYPDLNLSKPDSVHNYYFPAVLNECYATLMERFFVTSPRFLKENRKGLEAKWIQLFLTRVDSSLLSRSRKYGSEVAESVFDWSKTDTVGHLAHLFNYDNDYCLSEGMGIWQPCPDFPMPPLLPHWGKARTFQICPEDYLARALPAFSREPGSIYYEQALEVYSLSSPLSKENEWIAEFWSDDHAGLTFTTAGRWISITNQVILKDKLSPETVLETYLKIGMAMNDVIIAAWYSKYMYLLERPQTFIRRVFNPTWSPLHHTPPHPAYPSGHAMIGMAAAEVLSQLFGYNYKFTDESHKGRIEFKSAPRHYRSFYEMAHENALSRILLGVHFRMDGEEGIRLGKMIAGQICQIPIKNNDLTDKIASGSSYPPDRSGKID